MLTAEYEAALVKALRHGRALAIKKERKIFREGVDSILQSKPRYLSYYHIKSQTMIAGEFKGVDCDLDEINKCVNSVQLKPYDHNLRVEFDVEDEYDTGFSNCSDCGRGDTVPVVSIKYDSWSFASFASIKRWNKSSIEQTVRDAKFKFVHQAGGKDVRRYMSWIEKHL